MAKTDTKCEIKSILTDQVIQSVIDRMKSCKRTGDKDELLGSVVKQIFKYIDYFNTIGPDDDRILNKDLENIFIINEFVPYVTPSCVRYDATEPGSKDYLVRPEFSEIDTVMFSFAEYNNLISQFRGFFRKDAKTEFTRLSDIKVKKSISDVYHKAAFDIEGVAKVRLVSDSYVPILLDSHLRDFYRDSWFNETVTICIQDYVASIHY